MKPIIEESSCVRDVLHATVRLLSISHPSSRQWSVVKSPVARHAVGSQAPRHDALATDIMLPSKETREGEDA